MALTDTSELVGESNIPVITVSVGPVTPDDEIAKYTDIKPNTIWTDYVVRNRYEKDGKIFMLGVTSDSALDAVAFVKLSKSTLLWICDWTACKAGSKPTIPNPYVSDQQWVLLDESTQTQMIVAAADGTTPLYRISGTFIYGHRNPSASILNNMSFPLPPWLSSDIGTRDVPTSLLQQGIISETMILLQPLPNP